MTRILNVFAPPSHDRERRAFEYLERLLPDEAPFRGWANFEFVALDGAAFDVDALILCRNGLFLLEFVTSRGELELGERTWVHTQQNDVQRVFDNPYQLAARKARLLRSLLQEKTQGPEGGRANTPHIEPVVWLTEPDIAPTPLGYGGEHVVFHHDTPWAQWDSRIDDVLLRGEGPAVRKSPWDLTAEVRDRLSKAFDEIGVGRSGRHRKFGDWRLKTLLYAGPRHQDWDAVHGSRPEQRSLARIYSIPKDLPDDELRRLQESARREYEILKGLRHRNILAVKQQMQSERRPGLLFERPDSGVRLDHWLDANKASVHDKLTLLIQIAEAVRFAHRKSIVHRALTPQSVIVAQPPDEPPTALVYNWNMSRKEAVETGTAHIHDYMDDVAQAYLAPELSFDPAAGEAADIYGIGAIAYRLFAGAPPAQSLAELVEVLSYASGLRPSRVMDGVPEEVDAFTFRATRAKVSDRYPSMTEVIDALEELRKDVAAIAPTTDPLDASPGDLLDGRFEVVRRLGVGSTATALLAKMGEQEVVLKIANSSAHNTRLAAEAAALKQIKFPLIVRLIDTVTLGARHALVLQSAGNTLRERLREGALSLDELRRYGEDLCDILVELERSGTLHRDIKPSNLGIGAPSGSAQRLMLFDFSLADVSLEALEVGTPTYRDPFLREPGRYRWNEYADRYSGALTLYEMVTGRLPEWGDGRSDPVVETSAECNIESHLIPAPVREPLTSFFRKSFSRAVRDRFDNAEEARDAWRDAFQATTHTEPGAHDAQFLDTTSETRVSSLGLSAVALDALDRLNVVTVGALIALKPQELQFQKGVSNAIRRELTELRAQLVDRFPVEAGLAEASVPATGTDASQYSVDQVLSRIDGDTQDPQITKEFIAAILGGDDVLSALPWRTAEELAARTERDVDLFIKQFNALRLQWGRKQTLRPLRDDVVKLIENNGGALADVELAQRVLGLRGSLLDDADARLAASAAICRAAVEAELADASSRVFLVRRTADTVFIATREELRNVLPLLGSRAEELVAEHGVLNPARADAELQAVLQQHRVGLLPQLRLLTLAAAAAPTVALSSRNELYPVDLDPLQAVKLCAGIFVVGEDFTPAEIEERVRARYSKVAPFPGRPELDDILNEAGLNFAWDTSRRDSDGAYVNGDLKGVSLTRSTVATQFRTTSAVEAKQYSIKQRFKERVESKVHHGGFLVLTVDGRRFTSARDWLCRQYTGLQLISIDELFLQALRASADELGVRWPLVLNADAATEGSEDRRNLLQLVKHHVVPRLEAALLARRGDLLLTEVGLLARYQAANAMSILSALHKASGTADGPRMVWVLVPGNQRDVHPKIGETLIPTINESEHAFVPHTLADGSQFTQGTP